MEDHPILGGVLFAIGTVLVGSAYYSLDALPLHLFGSSVGIYTGEAISHLILGHIFAFNGVLLVVLGCRKLDRARAASVSSDGTQA
jgi:hypothetical protein